MTHTTQQLQAMSDFEVNKALAAICGEQVTDDQYLNYEDRDERAVIVSRNGGLDYVDYCNNPNDIMPLAFERKIHIYPSKDTDGHWFATVSGFYHGIRNENPLRAIACLLLLMED